MLTTYERLLVRVFCADHGRELGRVFLKPDGQFEVTLYLQAQPERRTLAGPRLPVQSDVPLVAERCRPCGQVIIDSTLLHRQAEKARREGKPLKFTATHR
jgi:hypothetical protein